MQFFAAAISSLLFLNAVALPSDPRSTFCGIRGYDSSNKPYDVQQDSFIRTLSQCRSSCLRSGRCKSYALGKGACILYEYDTLESFVPYEGSYYLFYDRSCGQASIPVSGSSISAPTSSLRPTSAIATFSTFTTSFVSKATLSSEPTEEPLPTGPQPTEEPLPTGPQPTEEPLPTGPEPTDEPLPTGPEPTDEPLPTGPEPTDEPLPTGPEPTNEPLPTGPEPTEEPLPTGPEQTEEPLPTGPEPTEEPLPTGPEQTEEPLPTGPEPTEEPLPTGPQPTGPQPTGPQPTGPQPTGPQPTVSGSTTNPIADPTTQPTDEPTPEPSPALSLTCPNAIPALNCPIAGSTEGLGCGIGGNTTTPGYVQILDRCSNNILGYINNDATREYNFVLTASLDEALIVSVNYQSTDCSAPTGITLALQNSVAITNGGGGADFLGGMGNAQMGPGEYGYIYVGPAGYVSPNSPPTIVPTVLGNTPAESSYWNLDLSCGLLTSTWTNQDTTQVETDFFLNYTDCPAGCLFQSGDAESFHAITTQNGIQVVTLRFVPLT